MASFGAPGAGLGDDDRRALKQGKQLLKGVFGAAGKALNIKGLKKHKRQLKRAARAARDDAQRAAAAAAARVAAARRATAAERDAAASSRAEAEADFKSLAAERALAARAAEELGAERRRRGAAERELDAAREAAQSHAGVVEAVLEDAMDVAARTQEFYETEHGEREAAQRTKRELRDQLRAMERELAALDGGGFEDASGLFGGVSGSVAARARGAALRAAKQELERRRADVAVAAAAAAARERAFSDELAAARADAEAVLTRDTTARVDAARAEAAACTAAADAAQRERDAAAACLAVERKTSAAAKQDAERQRARWYEASFELQAAEKHAQNTLDLKNRALEEQAARRDLALQEQAARSAAYREEVKRGRDLKRTLHSRGRVAEAQLKGTEAELGRLKADLDQARSTAAAQRSRAEEAEAARGETQRLQGQAAAWRNLAAAQDEMNLANYAITSLDQGCGDRPARFPSDAMRKRQHDAILNFGAARAAATASTQQVDRRPEDPPGRYAQVAEEAEARDLWGGSDDAHLKERDLRNLEDNLGLLVTGERKEFDRIFVEIKKLNAYEILKDKIEETYDRLTYMNISHEQYTFQQRKEYRQRIDELKKLRPPKKKTRGLQAEETEAARKSLEAARVETQKLRDQLQEQLDVLRAHALEDKKHALEDKKLARQYEAEAIAARDVELGQASLRGSLTQAELERTRAL